MNVYKKRSCMADGLFRVRVKHATMITTAYSYPATTHSNSWKILVAQYTHRCRKPFMRKSPSAVTNISNIQKRLISVTTATKRRRYLSTYCSKSNSLLAQASREPLLKKLAYSPSKIMHQPHLRVCVTHITQPVSKRSLVQRRNFRRRGRSNLRYPLSNLPRPIFCHPWNCAVLCRYM